jgi:hypothetical protein
MIKTFELFNKNEFYLNNIDPYGEEDWYDGPEIRDYFDLLNKIDGVKNVHQIFNWRQIEFIFENRNYRILKYIQHQFYLSCDTRQAPIMEKLNQCTKEELLFKMDVIKNRIKDLSLDENKTF